MTDDEKDIYAPAEHRPGNGTAFIVWAAILLAVALLQVVTIPSFLADQPTAGGLSTKIFVAVVATGLGVLLLVKGINRRNRFNRR